MIRTKEDLKELKRFVDINSNGANIHDALNKYYTISTRVDALISNDSFWNQYKKQYKKDIDRYEIELYKILKKSR